MITNKLKENKNVNFLFNNELTSEELNSFLNNADKVAVNLATILSECYYGNKIENVNISLSDEEVNDFLTNSINNLISKNLLDTSFINTFSTTLNSAKIILNYRKLSFNNGQIITTDASKDLFKFNDINFKKNTDTNTYGHTRPSNGLTGVGLLNDLNRWSVKVKVPSLNTINNYGHITQSVSEHIVEIPTPSSLDILYDGTIANDGAFAITDITRYQFLILTARLTLIDPNVSLSGGNITDYNFTYYLDINIMKERTLIVVLNFSMTSGGYPLKFHIGSSGTLVVTNTSESSAIFSLSITLYGVRGS